MTPAESTASRSGSHASRRSEPANGPDRRYARRNGPRLEGDRRRRVCRRVRLAAPRVAPAARRTIGRIRGVSARLRRADQRPLPDSGARGARSRQRARFFRQNALAHRGADHSSCGGIVNREEPYWRGLAARSRRPPADTLGLIQFRRHTDPTRGFFIRCGEMWSSFEGVAVSR